MQQKTMRRWAAGILVGLLALTLVGVLTAGVSHPGYAPPTVLYANRGTVDSQDAVSAYDKMNLTTFGMSRVTRWKVEVWKRPDLPLGTLGYPRGIWAIWSTPTTHGIATLDSSLVYIPTLSLTPLSNIGYYCIESEVPIDTLWIHGATGTTDTVDMMYQVFIEGY